MDGNVPRPDSRPDRISALAATPGGDEGFFVVSSDSAMRVTIVRMLGDGDRRVLAADSLEQLGSHLQGGRPVVVFDAGSTGESAARRLLARHPAVRLVYLTLDPFVSLGSERVRYLVRPLVASNLSPGLLRGAIASLLRS
jgi:hypothetical protein